MNTEAQSNGAADDPVLKDGHWWWWDGSEWLVHTPAGWDRVDSAFRSAPAGEPITEVWPLPEPAEVEPDIAQAGGSPPSSRPASARPASVRRLLIFAVILLLLGSVGGVLLWQKVVATSGSATPKPSGVAGTLTTLAANVTEWSATHPAVPGYPAGTAFVIAPDLLAASGKVGARYTNVLTSNKLITAFRFALPSHSTVGTARFALVRELPTDSTWLDSHVLAMCEVAHYNSLILSQVMGAGNESGSIVVVFRSAGAPFNSLDVAFADVTATDTIPEKC